MTFTSALPRSLSVLLVLMVVVLSANPATAQSDPVCASTHCLYLDPSAPIPQRVHDLVGRMTLEEKVSQMVNHAAAIPRLGVLEYNWWSEGLHGVARNGFATTFPQSIGLAATWDTDLMHQVADVISTEARAKYHDAARRGDFRRYAGLTFWSPNVNIFRDPRWGRGLETFGEDPFLSGRMGVEFVRGLQGSDGKYLKAVATPKHFAVHSGPEPDRHHFNVNVSKHDLEDTYLPAFRATVVESQARSVMCAYNAVDGMPACASEMLMQKHLREAWNFKGYVVSDCDAVADIARGHHKAVDNVQAAALALKAGDDLNCGGTHLRLADALKAGSVSEAEIDRSLERMFTVRFELGMFDPPADVRFTGIPLSENDSPAHRQLALEAARKSIVLLKNDGILPLHGQMRRIAVVGPSADMIEVLEGNYNPTAPDPVLPLQGIQKRFGAQAEVVFAPGSIFVEGSPAPVPSSMLRPEASSKESGLKAEYFDNADFKGTPRVVRLDKAIDFNWNYVSPAQGIPVDRFSVRWTGQFLPPAAGEYTLSFRGPEGRFRLYLDGRLLIQNKAPVKVTFPDAAAHEIRIECVHHAADTNINFQWQPPAKPLLDAAVKAATSSDVVVAFVGLSPDLEGEEMKVDGEGFKGGDRTRIDLPDVQQKLLESLKATGKPLVVVLTSGSALAVNWAQEHANAILAAWYPGEEGGRAIAETLAGDNNPSGRLPVTFYRSTADLPPFTDYSMANRTYRYFTGEALYPFGYGLSYSTFAYRNLKLSTDSLRAGDTLKVDVEVTNTSSREGDEVVELYLTPPHAPGAPHLSLQGFKRVHLAPGEAQRVAFNLDARQLSIVDEDGRRTVLPGSYQIWAGSGQPKSTKHGAKGQFRIVGTMPLAE